MALALGSSSSWKDSIKAQFKARDDTQTQPFKELVANCNLFLFFMRFIFFFFYSQNYRQMVNCYERTRT